ncbi:serine-protein kinase ATM [Orussus abietinus]|uniref:serine-protein kinase ATM n=1 Tax=Orussus abietinus TaxID=222816 RepID=UPI0006263978|nr:serine-protein kinase ATM [Orussus abietinus]
MSLSRRIEEILKGGECNTITGKKKCATDIMEVIENDEAVREINENTRNNVSSTANWNYIVDAIHRIIIKGADKTAKKSTIHRDMYRVDICSAMLNAVRRANSSSAALLKRSAITTLVLEIFGNKTYEAYHDTYLTILVMHILPVRLYWPQMSIELWREILKICVDLYNNPSSNMSKSLALDGVQRAAQYGCLQSHLLVHVKRLLSFLVKVFADIKTDKKVLLTSVYKLANTVCRQISAESRFMLCEFSENVLPDVINSPKAQGKYELLLLLVQVHHPGGAHEKQETSYAYNWDKWKSILQGIKSLIFRDVTPELLPEAFVKLASEVFKQLTHENFSGDIKCSIDEGPSIKRRRLSDGPQRLVDLISSSNMDQVWPMVQILSTLLKNYPECLKPHEVESFMVAVTKLYSSPCKRKEMTDSVCQLIEVLVQVERTFPDDVTKSDKIKDSWNTIWDVTLRMLSMNQNESTVHRILQKLIEANKAVNPNAFLNLYLKSIIKWSSLSLKTLISFCEHSKIPRRMSQGDGDQSCTSSEQESVKRLLLEWVFNISWSKMIMQNAVDDCSFLLVGLTLKTWSKSRKSSLKKGPVKKNASFDLDSSDFKVVERCYLAMNFEVDLYDLEEERHVEVAEKKGVSCVKEDVEFLIRTIVHVASEDSDDISVLVIRAALIAKILPKMAELEVIREKQKPIVMEALRSALEKVATSLAASNLLTSKYRFPYIMNILISLKTLYSGGYDDEVAQVIVSATTKNMLRNVFDLVNVEENYYEDEVRTVNVNLEDYTDFRNRMHLEGQRSAGSKTSSRDLVRAEVVNALIGFCCLTPENAMTDLQENLLKNFLKIDVYEDASLSDLKIAMSVLEAFGSCKAQVVCNSTMTRAFDLLLHLSRSNFKDEECARKILSVLPRYLDLARNFALHQQELLEVLWTIRERLLANNYGHAVYVEYIKCLSELARLDPTFTWARWSNEDEESVPIVEDMFTFVDSPFYVVRLEVARSVKVLFSRSTSVQWQASFLQKLLKATMNSFTVNRNLEGCEKADERACRVASALHVFATVISSSDFFQGRALIAMYHLVFGKDVDSKTVRKVLEAVARCSGSRDLVEANLKYLLANWMKYQYPLQEFPWFLTHCASQESFFREYHHVLVSKMIENDDLPNAIAFCKKLDIPWDEALKNSFSGILTWTLPHVVGDPEESPETKSATLLFQKLKNKEEVFRTMKRFQDLLEEKLDEVLVGLVLSLHDEECFEEMFQTRVQFAEAEPPFFKVDAIQGCFRYLEANFLPSGETLVGYLAKRRQDVLQKVLTTLMSRVYRTRHFERKLKSFHQYAFFGILVAEELRKASFDEAAPYVIRDVGYTLLHLIKEEVPPLQEFALKSFHKLLRHSLPERRAEVDKMMSFSVAVLTPVVLNGCCVPVAVEVLEFLIIEQKELLSGAIERLDSFPNHPTFARIRDVHGNLKYKAEETYTLDQEIRHFLDAGQKIFTCSEESLLHLREQLSTRKDELREMYEHLEELRGFAEDCSSSTLHRLTHMLVRLTRSTDRIVSSEAAKCLGELGPADLTTMILQPEETLVKDTNDPLEVLTYKVLLMLVDFLVDADVELRCASAEALFEVLGSHWGRKMTRRNYLKNLESEMLNEHTLCFDYIRPFITPGTSSTYSPAVDELKFSEFMNPHNELWTVESNRSDSRAWVTEVTCGIIACFSGTCLDNLIPVCRLSGSFCKMLLPRLVHLIVWVDDKFAAAVCRCINGFFGFHFDSAMESHQSTFLDTQRRSTSVSHESVRCMLDVVNFLRVQSRENVRLDLNYLDIAKAGLYCSAYFTSVLCVELWCQPFVDKSLGMVDESVVDFVCKQEPEMGKVVQDILIEAYVRIGDPDAIHGCGSWNLFDLDSLVQRNVHLRNWDEVTAVMDVNLRRSKDGMRTMLTALQQSGYYHLLMTLIHSVGNECDDLDDFAYESLWRLSDWNALGPFSSRSKDEESKDFSQLTDDNSHLHHYHALRCFHENDTLGLKNSLERARADVIKALRNASLESSKTVYPMLSRLQMLREVEELYSATPDNYHDVLEKWRKHDFVSNNDFQYVEPILAQRAVMFKEKDSSDIDAPFCDALLDTYLKIAILAEEQGYLKVATRALATLATQNFLSEEDRDQVLYRRGLLSWTQGHQDIARPVLRNLMNKKSLNPRLRAEVLRVYGNWMVEMKLENPRVVIDDYFRESIRVSQEIRNPTPKDIKNRNDSYAALAHYADTRYQQITAYMKSPQFESLKECIEYSRDVATKLRSRKDMDTKRAVNLNQQQSRNDSAELEDIKKERNVYLLLALESYLKVLQQSDDHNFLMFRLVSLWLDNKYEEGVNQLFRDNLLKIPSFKFLPLVPQLASRVSNVTDVFTKKINGILEKCAVDHPHHTLPVLLALMNLYEDHEYYESGSEITPQPRVRGAKNLVEKLLNTDVKPIIQEMNTLSRALVMLANWQPKKETGRQSRSCIQNIPSVQKIRKIRNLVNVNVLTREVPVRPNGNYTDVVGVYKYMDTYEVVGGINAPKKITCVGTDGIPSRELVKGKDDLRQDAVMQQVFTVMNSLLKASKEANKRKLNIRTYKVVPLSQRSGVLQWCDNTVPIGRVLIGGVGDIPGVHQKYYPNDYSASTCRTKMADAAMKSYEEKLKVYLECCKNMHPAFHHFFTETYPSPETWFERRLAFTRSVATTSIIGYILGLGDRHVQNILIDKSTAEVIHIDFGIAFEQGKVLPTPETVPFRLTRDMEVAMGASGVDGIMRRCCEETMRVLRDRKEIIIMLLQVLLYDPLFSWAITPAQAYNRQGGSTERFSEDSDKDSTGTNKLAERALLRVEQKLQGTEEGVASSVAGQVGSLIEQARDPRNLCRLFAGWQPYL